MSSDAGNGQMGRRSKLTPKVAKRIIRAVGLGLSYAEAARAAGICESTLHLWRQKGGQDLADGIQSRYSDFLERIERAQDEQAEKYLDAIERSVMEPTVIEKTHIRRDKDGTQVIEKWTETKPPTIDGAKWWLARRRPDTFTPRQQLEHSGRVDGDAGGGVREVVIRLVKPDGTEEVEEREGPSSVPSHEREREGEEEGE